MYEYYHYAGAERQPFGPPTGGQFGPPFGQPFGQQFTPPFGPPTTSPGASSGPPSGPPPSFTPSQAQAQQIQGAGAGGVGIFAVDPGAIRPCTFRYVFIWLNTGERFWAWLTFVGRRSAAGWRWTGFRWIYFGVDLRNIESFTCY